MFPVALSLGGLLARVAALAVVPRVISLLNRTPKVNLRQEAPVETPVAEAPAVLEAVLKTRQVATPRRQNSHALLAETPSLQAWQSPSAARAPPLAGAETRSRAYLYRRSFPINGVDPSGLDVYIYVKQDGPAGHAFFGVDDPDTGKRLTFDRNIVKEGKCSNRVNFARQMAGKPGQQGVINSPVSQDNLDHGELVHRYFTTSKQDREIIAYARAEQRRQRDFKLNDQNCATFVKDVLTDNKLDSNLKLLKTWSPYGLRNYFQSLSRERAQDVSERYGPFGASAP